MARTCDVCGAQVAQEQRFCPGCGLEIVEPDQPAGRTTSDDPWDWESQQSAATQEPLDGATQQYGIRETGPDLDLTREKLKRAESLFSEGRLRQCAELHGALSDQLGDDAKIRRRYQRLGQLLKQAKSKVLARAKRLFDEPHRLHRFLTGPAADQLDREDICRLALQAADRRYQQDAESVRDLLRLHAFRDLPKGKLRDEHQRLEDLVWRRSRRQHFFSSAVIFTVVLCVSIPGLVIWVWFLLQLPVALKMFISAAALVTLIWGIGPLRKWIELKVEGGSVDDEEYYED